jgi:hypothetical protein
MGVKEPAMSDETMLNQREHDWNMAGLRMLQTAILQNRLAAEIEQIAAAEAGHPSTIGA